jgi:hypothetical protein
MRVEAVDGIRVAAVWLSKPAKNTHAENREGNTGGRTQTSRSQT